MSLPRDLQSPLFVLCCIHPCGTLSHFAFATERKLRNCDLPSMLEVTSSTPPVGWDVEESSSNSSSSLEGVGEDISLFTCNSEGREVTPCIESLPSLERDVDVSTFSSCSVMESIVFLDISRGWVSEIYTFRDNICCKTSSKDKLWY